MSHIKISPQSRSFIILFSIAAVGVAVAFYVIRWLDIPVARYILRGPGSGNYEGIVNQGEQKLTPPEGKTVEFISMDTKGWKTYTDSESSFTFKYPPTWKVLAPTLNNGYKVITIDPGARFDNVKIYISSTGYFALDGIPYKPDTISGFPALNVQGMLFGVKANDTYYTFDEGASVTINPEFQTLVHSSSF